MRLIIPLSIFRWSSTQRVYSYSRKDTPPAARSGVAVAPAAAAAAAGAMPYTRKTGCPTYNFAVVVLQHPKTLKFCAVEETRNRGWWLPAGFVDPGESFRKAAHRETVEEAGVDIKIKGILRVEHSTFKDTHARMRVIFYAHPLDKKAPLKSEPDDESKGAKWMDLKEMEELEQKGAWRGDELLTWAKYIMGGGTIYPTEIFCLEGTEPKPPADRTFTLAKMQEKRKAKKKNFSRSSTGVSCAPAGDVSPAAAAGPGDDGQVEQSVVKQPPPLPQD